MEVGGKIEHGEVMRTDGYAGAVLMLAEGSRVEMRAQSELWLEGADDGPRIRLRKGGIVVNAARQRTGHLYVQTKDMTVSVVGTVFVVNTEETGSRVAVIEGEVHVQQGGTSKTLLPGEQVTTSPLMESQPVKEEISWSRNAEMHLALLQQLSAAQTAEILEFEVASIRPDPQSGNGMRGAPVRCNAADGIFPAPRAGPPILADESTVPRGRCIGRAVSLITLITAAYGVPARNVSGGPDWIRSMDETFQIEAKAESPATVTGEQLRQMLRTLLADRFKLKVRTETQEAPGYVLMVGKNGPRLRETSGDEDLYIAQDGRRNQFNLMRGGQVTIKGKARLKTFADYLSSAPVIALHHVLDKTELSGIYDFSLTLNMISRGNAAGGGPRGGGGDLTSGPSFEWDPPLAKALEDQLGLLLEPQRVPEEIIVIDRAERPNEN